MQVWDLVILMTMTIEDYSWVDPRYLGTPFKHTQKDGGINTPFVVVSFWMVVSTILIDKRVSHKFEGYFIPLYSCIFESLGVQVILTTFKKKVFDHLRVPLSQLHPRAWRFVRVFQFWYEYLVNMNSASMNIFFNLFKVNPPSKS